MQVKIYTKEYSPLTTLVQTKVASDFNELSYKETLHAVGDASFVMRLDNDKTTMENLKHYNIVEVCEDDGTPRWVGVIVYRRVLFDTVTISCYSLIHLLTKRLTPEADSHNDTAGAVATALLSTTNGVSASGITAGTLDDPTTVELTFSRSSVFDALKKVVEASGGQFRVKPDRTLDVRAVIGTDLSGTVILQYQLSLIAGANILSFQVEDDGKDIVTRTYGASGALSSDEEDTSLSDEFGLLENYQDFRELDDQTTLDNSTAGNNSGSALSPLLALSPKVADNFEVGDIVKVILKNRLIDISDDYQITEKSVKIKGGNQREITLRIISNTSDFFKTIKDMKRSLDLLNREV